MNWILTFLFLVISFSIYYLIGLELLEICKFKKITVIKSIVLGFFIIYFISFVIGVPCNLLKASWNTYFILYSFSLVILITAVLFRKKNHILSISIDFKKNWKQIIKNNFSNYWFLYLIVFVLSLLSMTNQMPYYKLNYDDHYYIGKVVQQIGTPHLLSEDFFSGALVNNGNLGLERLVNTYEITYGYFASLFHISVPFFCRGTMVIHNYFMVMFVCIAFANEFLEKKYCQYTLMPFCLFFISFGFLNAVDLPLIHMYDGWQFQTAIFYGSSIVRVLSIPVILLYGKDLIIDFKLKQFLLLIVLYCSLLSFSTIFIQIALFITYGLVIAKFIYMFIICKNKKRIIFGLLIFLMLALMLASKKLDTLSLVDKVKYNESIYGYLYHYEGFVLKSYFFRAGILILILGCLIFRNKIFTLISLVIFIIYFIFRFNYFLEINMLSSFYMFFVSLRTITSIGHVLFILCGMIVVKIILSLKHSKIILPTIAIFCFSFFISIFYINYDLIISMEYLGSGVSNEGYSIERLIKNDKLVPEIYDVLGDYFNSLEYGNYRLLNEGIYEYDNTIIDSAGFVMISNRIEINANNIYQLNDSEAKRISDFFENKNSYNDIASIIDNYNIQYILVNKDNQYQDLIDHGYECVVTYKNTTNFYLMKK